MVNNQVFKLSTVGFGFWWLVVGCLIFYSCLCLHVFFLLIDWLAWFGILFCSVFGDGSGFWLVGCHVFLVMF